MTEVEASQEHRYEIDGSLYKGNPLEKAFDRTLAVNSREQWDGKERIAAFIDVGTNSIRLLVVRINANRSFNILRQEKEVVRLGEGEFKDNMLIPNAIERAVIVCSKFTELSRNFHADDIVAVATSAAREARNQQELLDRMRSEAFLDLSVISGTEEARLIYLGVSSGLHIGDKKALFIDIGGGSCEVMIGDQNQFYYLDSLKLGAIRMTTLFVPEGHTGPITDSMYGRMCKYVKNAIIRTKKEVCENEIAVVVASSGTAINLAQIAARMFDINAERPLLIRRSQLKKLSTYLRSLNLEKRKQVPGINPERADIIIGGAATLETLMDELGLSEILVSERGLRDGLLVEYMVKIGLISDSGTVNVRERNILQLARSCDLNEDHARIVQRLALSLFDSAQMAKMHSMGDWERELLSYAAFLHDIGDFISYNNHHLHSYYIISNSELLGFDQREIAIMANIARFHRKKVPNRNDPEMRGLDRHTHEMIAMLSALLRIAESLDRSHVGLIEDAGFIRADWDRAVLCIRSKKECQLECWAVEADGKAFQKAYGRVLVTDIKIDS
jgi:exopolyphosphatase/guanosine-5'-triphosphate,3'-diphosphate pyrophosphatase